jgi:hypothetical protein
MPEFEFPPGMPEELKEYVIHHATRQEMEVNAHRHDLVRFFDELNAEQLHTLIALMGMVGSKKKMALYYQGYVTALMAQKFDVCAGCGTNHEQELLGEVTGDGTGEPLSPIDVNGNRIDTCSTCHGDLIIKVCEHPMGSHGQFGREECPEPTQVPCCECSCPGWYPSDAKLSLHQCGGSFLPLPEKNLFVCSDCGTRLQQ